jgi:dipeptidyl-peptidase-4
MAATGEAAMAAATPRAITVEDIANSPAPGCSYPVSASVSPDGTTVSFLHSPQFTLSRRLFGMPLADLRTGAAVEPTPLLWSDTAGVSETNISLAEALRRERERQLGQGITHYQWSPSATMLLIPICGSLYLQDLAGGQPVQHLRMVYDGSEAPALDPRFSPNGQWLSFVRQEEVCIIPVIKEGPPPPVRQLTHGDKRPGLTRGLAEYIAQEEMDRSQGYWWSPDSTQLVFAEVDESEVTEFRIIHQGKDEIGPNAQEDHRYPFAGTTNARVRLGIVNIADDNTMLWLDLGAGWEYLARVDWFAQGLFVQVQNRPQTELRLLRVSPTTGESAVVLTERSDYWINLHFMFAPIPKPDAGFVWGSERSGFMHLYHYGWDGQLVRALTSGEWVVKALRGLSRTEVFFSATYDSPLETHLYRVSLEAPAAAPVRLTPSGGTHLSQVYVAHGVFLDTVQSLSSPPTITLRRLADGTELGLVFRPQDPRLAAVPLSAPRIIELTSPVNGAQLYGALFLPALEPHGPPPYPLVVYCYGGPHVQLVMDSWSLTASMRVQYLRQKGYAVLILDNQGSFNRGIAFEGAIRWHMGDIEVRDQVAGVNFLAQQGRIDPQRVGIYGWSYGGYLAAMCITRAPDAFQAAVCGAPVTHWSKYDTHYTERYMGLPASNQRGYEDSSVMAHVAQLKGRIMIVHGLIDENVHFRHTAALINALIQQRKDYQLLLFPEERHAPRRLADKVYMEERIIRFFDSALHLTAGSPLPLSQ